MNGPSTAISFLGECADSMATWSNWRSSPATGAARLGWRTTFRAVHSSQPPLNGLGIMSRATNKPAQDLLNMGQIDIDQLVPATVHDADQSASAAVNIPPAAGTELVNNRAYPCKPQKPTTTRSCACSCSLRPCGESSACWSACTLPRNWPGQS